MAERFDEFLKIIQERRSVRHFTDQMPSDAQIQQLLEAARYAPSGANFQPWRFIVVKSQARKEEMATAVADKLRAWQAANGRPLPPGYTPRYYVFFREAPVVVAVLYKPYPLLPGSQLAVDQPSGVVREHAIAIQSAAAAIQNLLLAAHALGLEGCWMDNPLIAREELEALLGVREPWRLLALVPIGQPAEVPAAPRRKPIGAISEIINDEEGGEK